MQSGDLVQVRRGCRGEGQIGVIIERDWKWGSDMDFIVMFHDELRTHCGLNLKRIEDSSVKESLDETG